jgi:hypothetical protein
VTRITSFSIIIALLFGIPAFAETLQNECGYISEKNGFGEVVINGKQYQIDAMCEITDHTGYTLTPSSVTVQSRVIFEYDNDQKPLPAIKRIKLLPQ